MTARFDFFCVIALLFTAVTANYTYLPPPVPNQSIYNASNDTLADRIGGQEVDDTASEIHFEVEDSGGASLWQRQVDRIISQGVLQLALQLDQVITPGTGRELHEMSAGDNILFSPLSIAEALALLLLGAGGRTFQELVRLLGLPPTTNIAIHEQFGDLLSHFDQQSTVDAPTLVTAASAIFLQVGYPVSPEFLRASVTAYKSDVVSVDFVRQGSEAQRTVNAWVDNKTRGRIKDLLSDPPSSETRLLLASALYFNGNWEYPFPPETTSTRSFYAGEGDEVLQVPMMANSGMFPYFASRELDCRILGLPYKGGEVVMYVVLPNKPGRTALKDLERKLTVSAVQDLVSSTTEQSLIVLLPRMKMESTTSLKEALYNLGLKSLFDPRAANLSLISPGRRSFRKTSLRVNPSNTMSLDGMFFRERRNAENQELYVDDVIHKVEIEVTETGTVASSVTLVSVTRDGSRINFRVDRPFLFFIRHQPTGLLLFWGSISKPSPATSKVRR